METDSQLAQVFYSSFHARRTDLAARLEQYNQAGLHADAAQAEALREGIAALRKELVDAIAQGFLPSYDQRLCELHVKTLEDAFGLSRANAAPRAKLKFSRKPAKPPSAAAQTAPIGLPLPSQNPASTAVVGQPSASTAAAPPTANLILANRSYARLTLVSLPPAEPGAPASDLAISSLSHCIVDLRGAPALSAVQIRDVADSVLVLPLVSGAVMIHGAARCVLVVACQQFRMHSSRAVDVLLAIPSHPVIEHCAGVRFGALPQALAVPAPGSVTLESWLGSLPEGAEDEGLPFTPHDFSHIRATPSPHWSMLSHASLLARAPALTALLDVQGTDEAELVRVLEGALPAS